jgi:hypothetical protein
MLQAHPAPPFRHRLPADVATAVRATAARPRGRAARSVLLRIRTHALC